MKIPYKSKLYRFKNIENRNKAFKKLSKTDQKKEIALDALKLVIDRKLKAADGVYWGYNLMNVSRDAKDAKDFQQKLNNTLPKCEVCQRGLMMISQIRLSNTIDPSENDMMCGSKKNIKGFSFGEFLDMENEFEGIDFNLPYGSHTNSKLALICCNVIKNGKFKPKDNTDYLKLWKIKVKN